MTAIGKQPRPKRDSRTTATRHPRAGDLTPLQRKRRTGEARFRTEALFRDLDRKVRELEGERERGDAELTAIREAADRLGEILRILNEVAPGLTVEQASQKLGVSAPTVRHLARRGLLEQVPDRKPMEFVQASVLKLADAFDQAAAVYPGTDRGRALAAYLHDRDVQDQDWFRKGVSDYEARRLIRQ